MDKSELTRLKELAEKATPGPWSAYAYKVRKMDGAGSCHIMCDSCWSPNEAEFIAAANPATILALIGEIEQLKKSGGIK